MVLQCAHIAAAKHNVAFLTQHNAAQRTTQHLHQDCCMRSNKPGRQHAPAVSSFHGMLQAAMEAADTYI
jgi:hypothetical protein